MEKPIKSTLLLILGTFLMFVSSCSNNSHSALYQEIKSTNKLVLAKMTITKTVKVDTKGFLKWGKRIAVYSYDTYMQASIDLSSLQMEDLIFDESNKTVKVLLPPVITDLPWRDSKLTQKYENIGMLRDDMEAADRAAAKEEANKDLKNEVENNPLFTGPLIEAAKSKARKYFETIFENSGYTASIDFKPSK